MVSLQEVFSSLRQQKKKKPNYELLQWCLAGAGALEGAALLWPAGAGALSAVLQSLQLSGNCSCWGETNPRGLPSFTEEKFPVKQRLRNTTL